VIGRGSILTVAQPAIWRRAARYAANRDIALRIRYSSLPHLAHWLAHFIGCCNEASVRRSAQTLNPLAAAAYEHHIRLARLTGAEALIKRSGYLKLYRNPGTLAAAVLEREVLSDAGVVTSVLTGGEISELEPALKRVFSHALLFPENGSIDGPGRLVERYRETFVARGGSWLAGEARGLEHGSQAVTIHCNERRITASHVVIAAGAWSMRLLRPLGYRVPFTAERGYHAHFGVSGPATLERPIHDVDAAYAAAPIGGTIRVLTGIELAQPDDPPNFSQLEAAIALARTALPLADPVPDRRWHGSRPSTADGLPVIGIPARHPRLLLAFGHGHIGMSTGPVTGRLIAQIASAERPTVAIEPFAIERFSR
jgi:D-amino-acid dehydrogenase